MYNLDVINGMPYKINLIFKFIYLLVPDKRDNFLFFLHSERPAHARLRRRRQGAIQTVRKDVPKNAQRVPSGKSQLSLCRDSNIVQRKLKWSTSHHWCYDSRLENS